MAERKLHDRYFKQAKAEGYLARSAYKLKEIQEKKRIMRAGARVLDLGCAPGSWLQVASEIVGPNAPIIGIDLQAVTAKLPANIRTIQADAFTINPAELIALAKGLFDTVLSDMAPNTTGHGDSFLSVRLCRRVLEILPPLLRPNGNLVMKVLEGTEFPSLLKESQALFREARPFKPKACRDMSTEIYIIGHGYQPPAPLPQPAAQTTTNPASRPHRPPVQ